MTDNLTDSNSEPTLQLSRSDFLQRFRQTHNFEDPYLRYFDVCVDNLTPSRRVAVRRYTADSEQKVKDVLENMQSYQQLDQLESMCGLVGFCLSEETGEILAAFEYNDLSLSEALASGAFSQERIVFYLFLLRETTAIIEAAQNIGIQVEELFLENLLIQKNIEGFRLKLLYDERQKKYAHLREGVKAYASPQKVGFFLENGQEQEVQGAQQAIFELGLLLLDLMSAYEAKVKAPFSRDAPITRSRAGEGYLLFEENSVSLNKKLINRQFEELRTLNVSTGNILKLIQKMIADAPNRITLKQLIKQIQQLERQQAADRIEDSLQSQQSSSERNALGNQYQAPSKDEIITNNVFDSKTHVNNEKFVLETGQSKQVVSEFSEEKKETLGSNQFKKQTMVSQTTVATTNLTAASQTRQSERNYQKNHTEIIQSQDLGPKTPPKDKIMLPREQLLQGARWSQDVLEKFKKFMDALEERGFTRKEYYDKSLYFGSVDEVNQKRDGLGMYVYSQGDVYFGRWQQNTLLEGDYLFKNGESFSGTVNKGKQGYGVYQYANGNRYEGHWRNDIKEGEGTMSYLNGDSYSGSWQAGKKHGQGTYRYSNGTVYNGSFVHGKKQGFGTIIFPNGTKVEAYWNQTHIEGPGKVFYSNGNYFQGNYHRSEKQGQGLYMWDGAQYQGGFEKDAMQGIARIAFSEDEWYEGKVKNGRRWGQGTYHYSNGDQFQGEWRNDEKLYGRYRFGDGGWFEGRFKKGEMSYGVMMYDNGESYQGEFVGGERQGTGTYRDSSGKMLKQGRWQKDHFLSAF